MVAYKEGTSFLLMDIDLGEGELPETGKLAWEESITTGEGWSYGLEFLIRRTAGKFTGWIGYTLSWTQQRFEELNFGKKYYARYDRRHDVSIVLMYSPSNKINLSMSWVFASGNCITMPEAVLYQEGINEVLSEYMRSQLSIPSGSRFYTLNTVESYGEKNNIRMKPFHHLDIGIQFIKTHKRNWKSIWELSIYNVYNHKNPFFYFVGTEFKEDGSYEQRLKQICIFPIIPSLSYNFQF